MKRNLFCLFLFPLAWGAFAQETTTVQVAPSDQIIYPDASQILNKTPPTSLPSNKPLLVTKPVAATRVAKAPSVGGPGWYLRWTLRGDEAGVWAWAEALGRPVQVNPLAEGLWEVLAGPFSGDGLGQALVGQAGQAELVRK